MGESYAKYIEDILLTAVKLNYYTLSKFSELVTYIWLFMAFISENKHHTFA